MSDDLRGKTVVVTGGGSGLGAALCRTLAAAGANVAVFDLNRSAAARVSQEVREANGSCAEYAVDISDESAVERTLSEVREKWRRLDVVINNAGIDRTVPIEELASADWDRIIATNLRGPYLISRWAARQMKAQGGGHIVNIASTAAKRAWPNASAYHASKWGLLGLSYALHAELRPHAIKVTAVVAGGMRTPFLLERFPDIDVQTLQDPHDVATAIKLVLMLPAGTVIPEIMVLPMRESSWP
jgi:NAD(P)-dependent dehydrogenase (short-subunit alcohol dehydrogenase family)